MVGLVASGPEVETFGSARWRSTVRTCAATQFSELSSMTKPVTATAVMMLVEEGKLRLDQPVDRLLPELANRRGLRRIDAALDDTVPARQPITVEDLLIRRTCSAHHGFLYMSEDRDSDLLKTMAVMANRAEKKEQAPQGLASGVAGRRLLQPARPRRFFRDSPRETLANLSITGHLRCF